MSKKRREEFEKKMTKIMDSVGRIVADSFFNIIGFKLNAAIGDVKASELKKNVNFKEAGCHQLPLNGEEIVGVFAGYMSPICGPGTSIKICVVFNGCGTVGLVVGGAFSCIPEPFFQSISNFSVSYSYQKTLNVPLKLPHRVGNDLKVTDITFKSDFAMTIMFGIPLLKDLKFGSFKATDIFDISLKGMMMISTGGNCYDRIKDALSTKYLKGRPVPSTGEGIKKLLVLYGKI